MKKLLSILLAVVMICGTMTLGFTTVFAAETQSEAIADGENDFVTSIKVLDGYNVEIIENALGYITTRYDHETGKYEDYYFYDFVTLEYFDAFQSVQIEIEFFDGTKEIKGFNELYWDSNFSVATYQEAKPWVLGSDNKAFVEYCGKTAEINVTIKEYVDVDYIEVLSEPAPIEVNSSGYWDTRYNEESGEYEDFFCYYDNPFYGIPVRVHFLDGTTKDSATGCYVYYDMINIEIDQESQPFTVGSDNKIEVKYRDKKAEFYCTIVPVVIDPPQIIGDVNNDGAVDILDANRIQQFVADMITMTVEQIQLSDVNNDGSVDVLDSIIIKKFAAGKITEFPKAA